MPPTQVDARTVLTPAHHDPSPTIVAEGDVLAGRYRLVEPIGSGGTADVWRATDLVTDAPVAVKLWRTDMDRWDERCRNEIDALRRLDHPHLTRLHDCGTSAHGRPYLVLDLVSGTSLAQLMRESLLEPAQVRRIGHQLAGALDHAASRGVTHRDLKPSNVLVDPAGDAHLIDFGIARLSGLTDITATGMVIGSPAYLSPEQVRGEAVGPEADVFALGLVLLEAATGARAYPGNTTESLAARMVRPPSIPPEMPADLAELIASMTRLDAARRPTAAAVAEALGRPASAPALDDDATVAINATRLMSATAAPVAVELTTSDPAPRGEVTAPRRLMLIAAAVAVLLAVGSAVLGSDPPTATADPATAGTVVTTPPTLPGPPTTPVPAMESDTTQPKPAEPKGKAKGHHDD